MTTRTLGSTGVPIPPVLLGCGTFGGIGGAAELIGRGLDRAASFAALDEARELGVDLLDTAERYAAGESERAIAAWLADRPGARARIATKVAPPGTDGDHGDRFARAYVERKLATSLGRLGLDRVDLYLSHAPHDATPIEETLEAFMAVVEDGRVGHVGCCNVDARQLTEALDASERLGVRGFEWVQNAFSLLDPDGDRDVRAICRERGLGYTPFSPLAGGVMTGKYRRGEPFPPGTRMALRPEGNAGLLDERAHDALDRLRAAAEARGTSCAALALAWVIAHPDCSAPVVGPARLAPHLGHVAEAMRIELAGEEHEEIAGWFLRRGAV